MTRLITFFYVLFAVFFQTSFPQDIIKAKVAILHRAGDEFTALRSSDRLKAGEMIRIFVQPENPCYVYIIHSDNNESTLLFNQRINSKSDTLILPSTSEFYVFDNKSPTAEITIFCSIKKINDITKLFTGDSVAPLQDWNSLEESLVKKYKKNFSDQSEKPFSIAGNVGGINDDFLNGQLTLSGRGTLIRKYELQIKK
jgi:hypothetical protein